MQRDTHLRALMQRHTLLVFVGLAFGLSWSIWGLEFMLVSTDPISARWLDILATFGPTLAAIMLAALLNPAQQALVGARSRFWVAGAVLVGTVLINSVLVSNPLESSQPWLAILLLLLISVLPAWIVWNSFSRCQGVRTLLQTLIVWRVSPIWYVVALALPVGISLAGMALLPLFGQALPPWPRTEPIGALLPLLATTFVATLLYGGPLGEEVGWRGFALLRLQARFSPLVASLLLSVIWGLWHVPLHLHGAYHGIFPDGWPGILLRIITTVPTTILFTWFSNRTKGNLWLLVLLHTAVNNTAGFWLPVTLGVYVAMSIVMVILILIDRMWRVRAPESALT